MLIYPPHANQEPNKNDYNQETPILRLPLRLPDRPLGDLFTVPTHSGRHSFTRSNTASSFSLLFPLIDVRGLELHG
jgi:hypothetical protein